VKMNDDWLQDRRVAVLGLGIEGRDLSHFLAARGARLVAFDTRSRDAVAAGAAELEALGAEVRLGPIPEDAADGCDAIYVSQSVLLHREPLVLRARAAGKPVRSRQTEFFERWPGPIAAITGSSGKTTTTSLVQAGFAAAGVPHIVGGNIGGSLLGQLDAAAPNCWAVLEVSHTQLQLYERGPDIACVTNVTPNHLDQFSWDEYVDLKRNLVRHQSRGDIAVLNATNPDAARLAFDTPAKKVWFNADVPGEDSCFVSDEQLVLRTADATTAFVTLGEVPLRGRHNVENVLAAAAVTASARIPPTIFGDAVRSFKPVPHRLEYVANVDGAAWYNDSIATSPERTLAGLRSFEEPLVLLLGGREKNLPLDELAEEVHQRARAVICFGEAAGLLAGAIERQEASGAPRAQVRRVKTLDEAVSMARSRSQPGDVVLLSPACTSFDAYPNFERRGEEFRRLVLNEARKVGAPSQP